MSKIGQSFFIAQRSERSLYTPWEEKRLKQLNAIKLELYKQLANAPWDEKKNIQDKIDAILYEIKDIEKLRGLSH